MTLIRDYQAEDAPRLWEILGAALAPYGLCPLPEDTDQDLRDVHAAYISGGGAFRVLVHNELIIGMYGLHRESAEVVELRKMYLVTSKKGQGYGRLLMEDALEQARALGFDFMVLETNTCLIEAVGLYRKFGFAETERPDLSPRCDMAMRLKL